MKRMAIEIDPSQTRRWHRWLVDEMKRWAPSLQISVLPRSSRGLPATVEALLLLERQVFGRESALDRIECDSLPFVGNFDEEKADIVLNLTDDIRRGERRLNLSFDGVPAESGVLLAILRNRCPAISLHGAHGPVFLGRPALQGRGVIRRAANSVLARTARLVAQHVGRAFPSPAASGQAPDPVGPQGVEEPEGWSGEVSALHVFNNLVAELSRRARRQIRRLLGAAPPAWRTGWRHMRDRRPLWQDGRFDPSEWSFLPDDRRRFFADPFPFMHENEVWLFVEEYPFATRKGLISVCRLDMNGNLLQPPAPVLEVDVHASYPLVFRHEGRIWMIPETSAAGEVRLYRCERFPDRWREHAVLIEAPISDATLFHDGTCWWIMGSDTTPPASSWDTLMLYYSEHLEGPWKPHPHNPVLVDCAAARPGGLLWREKGKWVRPVQVCEKAYGAELAICEMDAPHPERPFTQRVLRTVRNVRGGHSVHTYNRLAALEFIDTSQLS